MRLKYIVEKTKEGLTVKEFGELEAASFSLTCEEQYDLEAVSEAVDRGKASLISLLRTHNLFPAGFFMDRIADTVMAVCSAAPDEGPVELILNDADLIQQKIEVEELEVEEVVEEGSATVEINELLDDDLDPKTSVDVSSIKVAEDDSSFDTD